MVDLDLVRPVRQMDWRSLRRDGRSYTKSLTEGADSIFSIGQAQDLPLPRDIEKIVLTDGKEVIIEKRMTIRASSVCRNCTTTHRIFHRQGENET